MRFYSTTNSILFVLEQGVCISHVKLQLSRLSDCFQVLVQGQNVEWAEATRYQTKQWHLYGPSLSLNSLSNAVYTASLQVTDANLSLPALIKYKYPAYAKYQYRSSPQFEVCIYFFIEGVKKLTGCRFAQFSVLYEIRLIIWYKYGIFWHEGKLWAVS